MSLWGKLAGAVAVLGVGGPIGSLLSGLARQLKGDRNAVTDLGPASEVAFLCGVIALGAKMAKADGMVTRDEVSAFKEVFQVPPGEVDSVARFFDLAKTDVAGYESYAQQLADMFKDNRDLLEDVLDGLFHIATADGVLHEDEDIFLKRVAKRFGFSKDEYRVVRARFLPDDIRSPYRVLGVAPEIESDALKTVYRRLVTDNHPDRAIARGMPAEFIRIATDKLAAINEAYEQIRRERGL